ncbi:GNAT family N-acetyltransferase [Spirillospora sp. CA-294931]|uniref:GNAT family N-acetyltransferase n=1 Tax=Spirillospora sp. CA-294931 TaxID=3240042 RepID=UPI003D93656D
MDIRRGGPADLPVVLGMLDGAVEWLSRNGREGQWGTQPWSGDAARVERISSLTRDDIVWIAEIDGRPAGAMTLGTTSPHYITVDPGEPEVYVTLLVTDRAFGGHGVGAALLDHARSEARALGVRLLRVDCYAGGDGRLVAYYRRQGFSPVESFSVGEWPGRLLSQRLD